MTKTRKKLIKAITALEADVRQKEDETKGVLLKNLDTLKNDIENGSQKDVKFTLSIVAGQLAILEIDLQQWPNFSQDIFDLYVEADKQSAEIVDGVLNYVKEVLLTKENKALEFDPESLFKKDRAFLTKLLDGLSQQINMSTNLQCLLNLLKAKLNPQGQTVSTSDPAPLSTSDKQKELFANVVENAENIDNIFCQDKDWITKIMIFWQKACNLWYKMKCNRSFNKLKNEMYNSHLEALANKRAIETPNITP
jgi:hypothetical protein